MRINRILKTAGFLSLLGISVFLSISLSAQLAQPKDRFPLVKLAETEGWCVSSSITYEILISKEKPFVLFEDPEIGAPLHTDDCVGTKGGYWANYPEVTPYFLVVIENDGTSKRFFTGGADGNKKMRLRIDAPGIADASLLMERLRCPHDIVNLSENGLELSDAGIDEAIEDELTEVGAVNWKGLYYALGFDDNTPGDSIESLKLALANTNTSNGEDRPHNDLEIVFDKDNPFQVVAIKTWNYNTSYLQLPIEFVNFVQDPETDLPIWPFGSMLSLMNAWTVDLNIDNVDLVREEIQRHIYLEDGSLEDFIPEPGEHIDDKVTNLGSLVVAGIIVDSMTGEGRTYDEIIEILVDIALGNTANFITGDLPSGGGIDWLQVAAADIYNADVDSEVFQCVWEIISGSPPYDPSDVGEVFPNIPYIVYLNPFYRYIRFNTASNAYEFHSNKSRDSLVWHESLHSYQSLPGRLVNDEEDGNEKINDKLYVKQGGGKTPYHTFAYDDKSRGFVKPNPFLSQYFNISTVLTYSLGFYGDDHFFNVSANNNVSRDKGYFIVRIDDKLTEDNLTQLFTGQGSFQDIIPDPFIDFGFPEDLPVVRYWITQSKVYLFVNPGIDFEVDYLSTGLLRETTRVESDYGYYDSQNVVIDNIGSFLRSGTYPAPKTCLDLLKRGQASLWAIFTIQYPDDPDEYDASYFSDISRGRRS